MSDGSTGTDLVGLVAQQERLRQIAGSYSGYASNPGLAASLVTAGVGDDDVNAIGGFVKGLELSKRVTLARQSGVLLNLSDEDRGLLAAVGSHYDDVDKSAHEKIFQAGRGGVLGTLADWTNHATQLPVIRQGLAGLDRAADIGNTLYRGYSTSQGLGFGSQQAIGDVAEQATTMQQQGYDPDVLGTMSFYSRGKQQFHNLDDLRKGYSPDMVDDAKRYLINPESYMANSLPTEELIRRNKLIQDPRFQSLVTEVDGRHISPGRDVANSLGLDPGSKPFTVVSGSTDALYSWYADPTLILGKANKAVKQFRYGLGQLADAGRVEDLMRGNRAIRNGWTQLLDSAKIMRTGSKEEAAAAYAKVRATTPDLLPVLDEIHGGGLREGVPITTYEDLIKHVKGGDALVRLRNGIAAKEAPLMPGALSRHGYTAVKGALAAAATRHGLRTIDLTENAGRIVSDGAEAINAAGEDISAIGKAAAAARRADALLARGASQEEIDAGAFFVGEDAFLGADAMLGSATAASGPGAAAVGQAAAAWRRSARGRAATLVNRMTTLLPEHSYIDLRSGQGAEDVRRFAALYMPKAHASALASRFAVASLAERKGIAEAVYEQVMHAAGLPATTSGRAWIEAERSKRAFDDNSVYDNSGLALDRIAGVEGEATRRNALYLGQTNMHYVLPNVVLMRRMAAKVSIYDHLLRSGMESQTLDKVMSFVRNLWLINPASAVRQVMEAHAASAASGLGPLELAQSGGSLAALQAKRAAAHFAEIGRKEVDAEFRPVRGHLRGFLAGRVATNMKRAEAFAGKTVSTKELRARSADLVEADLAGELNELKAVTGFATRGAHQSIDEAKEILDRGYKVAESGFKRAGWHLDSADGLGGAKYWSDELGRRFAGSDGPKVLKAVLEDTEHAVKPTIKQIREWWVEQGKIVPANEGRISNTARKEYAAAHPPRAREELVEHLLSDEFKSSRAVMERFSVLRDGTKVGDSRELLERAARELAADQILDMRSLITGRDGKIDKQLAQHLKRGQHPPRRHEPSGSTDPEPSIGGDVPAAADGGWSGPVPSISFLHSLGEHARPENVIQPKYVPDLEAGGKTAGNLIQALGRGAYDIAVSRPMQHFASMPIFQANYVRAYRNIEPIIRRNFDLGDMDLGLEGINRMGAAESGEEFTARMQHEMIRDAAIQHAMAATVKLIDNPRVQTQMSLVTRNLFNFWRAQEDFARRWGRILKENPEALRKGQLIIEGGMHTGLVYQDEQGELVFAYPGSGYAIQAIGATLGVFGMGNHVGLGATPNLTTKLQFLNSGIDRPFMPSTSPVASLPLRVLKHWTGDQVGMIQGVQIAEGEIGAGRSWWAQFLPSPVHRVMVSLSTDEREGQYASAARNAMLNLYAAKLTPGQKVGPDGKLIGASPDDQQKFKDRIRTGVRNHLLSRALLALVLPGAPSNPTEETDASRTNDLEKAAFNSVTLQGEYRSMVNKYGPQKALAVWTASHPDDLIYTVSTTEGGGYIAPTEAALSFLKDNPALVKQYPSLAAYFSPNGPGDFSQSAWQAELELGLRKHKNLDDFYRDVVVKNAETTYFDSRDDRDAQVQDAQAKGDKYTVKAINESFAAWSDTFQKANPLLVEKWQASDLNKAKIAQLVGEVEKFANSPHAAKFDPNGDLPGLVDAYNRWTQYNDTHKGRTDSEQAEKSAVEQSYRDWVGKMLGRSPYLLPLYRGVYDKVS